MDCGGHGLYATVPEYMKFIRMFLNDGAGPNGRVLKAETVEMMMANHLQNGLTSGGWKTSIASLSNDGEFDPGAKKTWGLTSSETRSRRPRVRPAGSAMVPGWPTCSSGSTAAALEATGARRFCRFRTRPRTRASPTSKARFIAR